jgi:sucrose-6F-phosphate phosphohydrolase
MDGRQLVVSDLDGTLLGDDAALARFARWHERVRHRVSLVYASGRLFESVRESVDTTDLPEPAAIIGGVGSQIRCPRTGADLVDWPAARRPQWDARQIRRALASLAQIEIQPEEFQSDYKVSYFLRDATDDDLRQVCAALDHDGLEFEVVYSSREHLDLLPRGVNKGTAALRLAQHWGIQEAAVIVCGDTGNDLALFEQGFRGVVVANAQAELKRLAGERIYLARQAFAAGVLEGLRHWLG